MNANRPPLSLTGFTRPHTRRRVRVSQTKLRGYLESCLTQPGA